jgi:hypothetical protein
MIRPPSAKIFLRLYDNPPGERRVFLVRPDESGASGLTVLLRLALGSKSAGH